MALAIFDLDNTLLGGDSDHLWGEFLVEQGLVDKIAYQQSNDYFYEQYKQGCMDIYEFTAFAFKPLTEHSLDKLRELHAQFMREKVAAIMLDKAAALLQKHREQGDVLLVITATNSFVTAPICAALGIDNLLATEPEFIDGRYTGKLVGTPCFQMGKVDRLNIWLKETGRDLQGSYFYSDSINDLPLLERVDIPIAVDPDEKLSAHARTQGWEILSLR